MTLKRLSGWLKAAAQQRLLKAATPPALVLLLAVGGGAAFIAVDSSEHPPPAQAAAPPPATTPTITRTATPRRLATPTPTQTAEAAGFEAAGAGAADPGPASSTGMTLVIPKIGVNAPVNLRIVGPDGSMHNPNGPTDVVWYDFSAFPGLGGYPGSGGNAVFAGHVDYHDYGPAVFWSVRDLVPGDAIEVYLPDGGVIRYAVQWSEWIDPNADFASYAAATGEDTLTIVTCVGTFNYETRQYSHRLVLRAIRV